MVALEDGVLDAEPDLQLLALALAALDAVISLGTVAREMVRISRPLSRPYLGPI